MGKYFQYFLYIKLYHISVPEIKKRWRNLRDTYVKLTKTVSGSGSRTLTGRNNYILNRLAFLKEHVRRNTGITSNLPQSDVSEEVRKMTNNILLPYNQ